MENKKLKRLMTDLAKGRITQPEVDEILKSKKSKKKKLNALGGKTKSHKII